MKRLVWPFWIYRVTGDSMLPTYQPGDTLLGWRWMGRPRVSQIVVVLQGSRPIIKRVAKVASDEIWLLGDNLPQSTDSRHFGALPLTNVQARIIGRLG